MTYKIEMRQDGQWWRLGGTFSAQEADDKILQFVGCVSHKAGTSREFRRVQVDEPKRSKNIVLKPVFVSAVGADVWLMNALAADRANV